MVAPIPASFRYGESIVLIAWYLEGLAHELSLCEAQPPLAGLRLVLLVYPR